MVINKRLSKIYDKSLEIPIDDNSKIILMSDCHRSDGSISDNFSKNQNVFYGALTHYYNNGYTYIEIGDGDELWEEKNPNEIIREHSDDFLLMSKLYEENRLYWIYGNHDINKKSQKFMKNHFYNFFDEWKEINIRLFRNMKAYEGIKLRYNNSFDTIFLVHGHQADFISYEFLPISRFLVRYLWKNLEIIGVNDPTSTAKNYSIKNRVEHKLIDWVKKENKMLIAGHTHRPVMPKVGRPLYFNTGSCVHPRCITGIEIENGCISLIKCCIKTKRDGVLFVNRDIMDGPIKLSEYFNN